MGCYFNVTSVRAKWHLIRLTVFAWCMSVTDGQTDRQTTILSGANTFSDAA